MVQAEREISVKGNWQAVGALIWTGSEWNATTDTNQSKRLEELHNAAIKSAVEAERNRIVGIIGDYEDTTQHGDTGSDAIRWILAEIERSTE